MVNSFIELLIKDKIIPDESKEIYLYGIYVIVFNLIVVVDILLIGFILNQLKYSIYFLIFWIPYRIFVGGSHCSTPSRCIIVFSLLHILGIMIFLNFRNIIYFLNIFLMIIQIVHTENSKVILYFWVLYFIGVFILPLRYVKILVISYFMNTILNLHSIRYNKII